MRRCVECNRRWPERMYRKHSPDWAYKKLERVWRCRVCSFSHPVRYRQKFTDTGNKKLEPYAPTLKQRLWELVR